MKNRFSHIVLTAVLAVFASLTGCKKCETPSLHSDNDTEVNDASIDTRVQMIDNIANEDGGVLDGTSSITDPENEDDEGTTN